MLQDLFPHMPLEREPDALRIYDVVFGALPLDDWTLEGTRLLRYVNDRKLAFSPRKTHCTIGFIGRSAVEFYRFSGGECPCGEVTIKIPYRNEWDPAPVVATIDWYLNN